MKVIDNKSSKKACKIKTCREVDIKNEKSYKKVLTYDDRCCIIIQVNGGQH